MIKKILIGYLIIINLVSLLLTLKDKIAAKRKTWRTPEKAFIFLSVMGGGLGVFSGFNLFRHKTLHKKLYFGVFAVFITETVILLLVVVGIKMGYFFN